MNIVGFIGTQELVIVAIVAVVLFGGSQLPKLARNLGRAQKELREGMAEGAAEAETETETEAEAETETETDA